MTNVSTSVPAEVPTGRIPAEREWYVDFEGQD
jgi:hypothetical protein